MIRLPGFTDLSNGLNRRQAENILAFGRGVSVIFDGEEVAALLPMEDYLRLTAAEAEEAERRDQAWPQDAPANQAVDEAIARGEAPF